MGGTCNSRADYPGQYPGEFSIEDLSALAMGASKDYPSGCGPFAGSHAENIDPRPTDADHARICKARGFKYPETGEFESVMGAACEMCSRRNYRISARVRGSRSQPG